MNNDNNNSSNGGGDGCTNVRRKNRRHLLTKSELCRVRWGMRLVLIFTKSRSMMMPLRLGTMLKYYIGLLRRSRGCVLRFWIGKVSTWGGLFAGLSKSKPLIDLSRPVDLTALPHSILMPMADYLSLLSKSWWHRQHLPPVTWSIINIKSTPFVVPFVDTMRVLLAKVLSQHRWLSLSYGAAHK